jgi:hypothetical protein
LRGKIVLFVRWLGRCSMSIRLQKILGGGGEHRLQCWKPDFSQDLIE